LGYAVLSNDIALFTRMTTGGLMVLVVYVDDILVAL